MRRTVNFASLAWKGLSCWAKCNLNIKTIYWNIGQDSSLKRLQNVVCSPGELCKQLGAMRRGLVQITHEVFRIQINTQGVRIKHIYVSKTFAHL